MKRNKILKVLPRVIISIIFIFFLLYNANMADTFRAILRADHKIWLACIILYIVSQIISAYKWKIIAKSVGFQNKFKEYVDYYFIGMFFNLFLPTTIGGDVAKCYYLSKKDLNRRKAPSIYTVLAERYSGVVVIVWLATLTIFFPVGNVVPVQFKIFMVMLTLMILTITPLVPSFWLKFFKKKKWVRTMLRDIRIYWKNPGLVFRALGWSLIFHSVIILIHLLIANAMGIDVPLFYYFIIYPMSAIVGFIPLAFNGIGPREATYVYFFSLIGIKPADALAFSIFWFGIVLCSSLIGGIFYIRGKHSLPPEEFDMTDQDNLDEDESEELISVSDKKLDTPSL